MTEDFNRLNFGFFSQNFKEIKDIRIQKKNTKNKNKYKYNYKKVWLIVAASISFNVVTAS